VSSGHTWPDRKVTVNLAPPTHRKTGSGLDLAIAIAVLVAMEVIPPEAVHELGFLGELGLDGTIRRIAGVAPMVGTCAEGDWVVPSGSTAEAKVIGTGVIRHAARLATVVEALTGAGRWSESEDSPVEVAEPEIVHDLAEVKGQRHARRALEVAAAGGHHLLFVGPPGAGKTMLASRLPGLLPDLDSDTALQTTMIHSAAGAQLPKGGLVLRPPFRAPHHTSSAGSLVGGGSHLVRPGEISLAHGGVLFLDEMGQFPSTVLDTLREALEKGSVMVGRVDGERVPMPARFQLIGATNPCPCGGGGAPGDCNCNGRARERYIGKLSGPLLDRFDLRVAVSPPDVTELFDGEPGESSIEVATRVTAARQLAVERSGSLNAHLHGVSLSAHAVLTPAADAHVRRQVERGHLTARGLDRIRRVARTLADLAGQAGDIDVQFVLEALAMRTRVGNSSIGRVA
jgi:magnesium chelatase family protein